MTKSNASEYGDVNTLLVIPLFFEIGELATR